MFLQRFIDDLKTYDLVALDVGARGGASDELAPIGRAVRMIGFEPEPIEAERLSRIKDERWADVKVLPYAIGGFCGKAPLYIPASSVGASLLKPNEAMLEQFGTDAFHVVKDVVEVQLTTLDALRGKDYFDHADYLKVDVEGAELDILKGADELLKTVSVLKLEVSFVTQRIGHPLIWEIVAHLRDRGFEVVDILDVCRWRRRPLPAHPFMSRFEMPYSKGRLAFCDLLLFRSLETVPDDRMRNVQIALAAGLGCFDRAIEVLRKYPELERKWRERRGYGLEETMRQASQKMGKAVGWQDLKKHVRQTVPRVHSLLTGIPYSIPNRPY